MWYIIHNPAINDLETWSDQCLKFTEMNFAIIPPAIYRRSETMTDPNLKLDETSVPWAEILLTPGQEERLRKKNVEPGELILDAMPLSQPKNRGRLRDYVSIPKLKPRGVAVQSTFQPPPLPALAAVVFLFMLCLTAID
jgi:hypothetical protein